MKKLIIISLVFTIVSFLIACGETKAITENNDIKAKKGMFNVEITLPSYLIGGKDLSLDKEAKEKGIKEFIKNKDGSVTMKMSKEGHKKLLNEIKASIDEEIEDILLDKETYSSFDSISYNEDVTEFEVKVDSRVYHNKENLAAWRLYVEGSIYQSFNCVSDEDVKIMVHFMDKDTGKVIESLESGGLDQELGSVGGSN